MSNFIKKLKTKKHHSLVLLCILLTSCETWQSFTGSLKGNSEVKTSYDDLVETLPPDKAETVRRSLDGGDITTAVNVVVAPPTDNANCVTRVPASIESTDACPNLEYENSRVLYIGDSHSVIPKENPTSGSERLGNVVGDAIEACSGATLSYYAVCGSRPRSWTGDSQPSTRCGITEKNGDDFSYKYSRTESTRTDNLQTIIKNTPPKHVLINLGDNMFSYKKVGGKSVASVGSRSSLTAEIEKMLNGLPHDATCSWVGPTYHKEGTLYKKTNAVVDEFYEVLSSAIGSRCELIDSRPFFSETSPNDGLHLIRSESRIWGQSILSEIRRQSH
jgi:hypothetical protein